MCGNAVLILGRVIVKKALLSSQERVHKFTQKVDGRVVPDVGYAI